MTRLLRFLRAFPQRPGQDASLAPHVQDGGWKGREHARIQWHCRCDCKVPSVAFPGNGRVGDGDRAESSGMGEVDQGREREGRAVSGETQRCIVLFVAKHVFSQLYSQVSQLIQKDWLQKASFSVNCRDWAPFSFSIDSASHGISFKEMRCFGVIVLQECALSNPGRPSLASFGFFPPGEAWTL